MRYFLVHYYKKPTGQMDEVVSVSRRLKTKDLQCSAVILDFKDRVVCQAHLNGMTVPKDFQRIRDFYHQHYARMIEDLESLHGPRLVDAEPVSPDTSPGSD